MIFNLRSPPGFLSLRHYNKALADAAAAERALQAGCPQCAERADQLAKLRAELERAKEERAVRRCRLNTSG